MTPSAAAVTVVASLTEDQASDVRVTLDRTGHADGVVPLSEAARLRLRPDTTEAEHLIVTGPDGSGVAGYAQVELGAGREVEAELFVDPQRRRRGIGQALGRAVLDLVRERLGAGADVSMWAHGDLPGSSALAARLGLVRTRDLLQLRLRLDDAPEASIPEPVVPPGVGIRTFRPGSDDEAWLRLNATAFASHPEQGGWTAHDLELRLAEPWFDPEGFFLAERDGRLIGFHWTKVHADEVPPLGEVYVLGIDPAESGHGLGSLLTSVGLRHLQERGLRTVMLYVEATNPAALTVYERLGFERYAIDVSYRTS